MAITGGDTNGVNMTLLIAAAGGDKVETKVAQGNVKCFTEPVTLATQAKSKSIGVAFIPFGSVPLYGVIFTDTSLGAATISIGPTADPDKYRLLAVLTAVDTPEIYGTALPSAGAGYEITADEVVLITNSATADLPAAGNLINHMFWMTAQ